MLICLYYFFHNFVLILVHICTKISTKIISGKILKKRYGTRYTLSHSTDGESEGHANQTTKFVRPNQISRIFTLFLNIKGDLNFFLWRYAFQPNHRLIPRGPMLLKQKKKTDQQNINFRAREVTLKLTVGPIIMRIPLWKQRQLHKENLDFDVDP